MKFRETEAALGERNTALGEAKGALARESERVQERDAALKQVADILRRAVRIFDVCARYGGEEFVIVMPGAGPDTALRIAERIRRQVEQHFAAGRRSGVPVPLTVSIGVGTASPGVTREALIAQADRGLLVAKSRGKNQVVQQFDE